MIEFGLKHPRCNLYASMGTGKSSVSLAIIDALLLCGYVNRVLILAPKRVATDVWGQEIEQWATFRHLRYALAVGGKAQRAAAVASGAEIVIVNYDVLPAFCQELERDWPFDMVVSDEVTKLKSLRVSVRTSKKGKEFVVGQGGKQSRAIAKIAHSKIKRWIGLTGSPAPNGIKDVWATTWFVDAGQRLGRSYSAFEGRWFRQFKDADERTRVEPYAHSQEEIQARIKDVCLTIEAKDYFDLPPLLETVIAVNLPPKAMAMYREFEAEMFLEINGSEIEAFNSGAMTNKCRQIASGFAYHEDGQWEHIHDAKIEALRDIVEESNGAPLLISYQFKAEVAAILKAFPQAATLDKPNAIKLFQEGQIAMLLVHAAAAGHGLNFAKNCWTLVDFSTGFNLEHDEQIIERIGPTRQAQGGYNRTVYRYRLVANGTIESHVVRRVKTKASIQQMLKDALKIA